MIEDIFDQLQKNQLCRSGYDFSRRFLGKSQSYFSVLRATAKEPGIGTWIKLEDILKEKAEIYCYGEYPSLIEKKQALDELSKQVALYRKQIERDEYLA